MFRPHAQPAHAKIKETQILAQVLQLDQPLAHAHLYTLSCIMQQDKTYELNKSAVKSSKRQTYRAQSELPTHYVRYDRTSGRAARNTSELPFLRKSQNFQKHALWNFHAAHPRYFRYAELQTAKPRYFRPAAVPFLSSSTSGFHLTVPVRSNLSHEEQARYYRRQTHSTTASQEKPNFQNNEKTPSLEITCRHLLAGTTCTR